jgi:hypothetical protein
VRSSLSNEDELAAVFIAVQSSLPFPIPFVNYQELEPTGAVILLLTKAATILDAEEAFSNFFRQLSRAGTKRRHLAPSLPERSIAR